MANNGKLKLSDYDLTKLPTWELDKVNKAIAKRQRRKDREQKDKDRGKNEHTANVA